MKLSLIIPLLEAQIPALPRCLEMLSRQTLSEFEVMVIGSSQTEPLFSTYADTFVFLDANILLNPRQILEQCFTFLGLDTAQLKFTKPKIIFNKSNYAHALSENESLYQKLNAFFKSSNTRLKEKFGLDFDWL